MKISESTVTKYVLTDVDRLDPVQIIAEDLGKGLGRLTISCFGKAWTNFWGGMGAENIIEFICTAHIDYLTEKLHVGHKWEIDWDKVNEEVLGPEPSFLSGSIDVTCAGDYDTELSDKYGEDWRMELPERITSDYRYLTRIVTAVQEALKTTLPPECEEKHLAAALGNRPCTDCGDDSWVKDKNDRNHCGRTDCPVPDDDTTCTVCGLYVQRDWGGKTV